MAKVAIHARLPLDEQLPPLVAFHALRDGSGKRGRQSSDLAQVDVLILGRIHVFIRDEHAVILGFHVGKKHRVEHALHGMDAAEDPFSVVDRGAKHVKTQSARQDGEVAQQPGDDHIVADAPGGNDGNDDPLRLAGHKSLRMRHVQAGELSHDARKGPLAHMLQQRPSGPVVLEILLRLGKTRF